MKDFHPHDGIALPIRNIGVFPRLIFKYPFYVISLQGIQTLFASSFQSIATNPFPHYFDNKTLPFSPIYYNKIVKYLKVGECRIGYLRNRLIFTDAIYYFKYMPSKYLEWFLFITLWNIPRKRAVAVLPARRKRKKGFSEFSISSLLYEKGTLYSARTLLSFTCFPFVEGEPVYKGNFL